MNLSDLGRTQARAVGDYLREAPIDAAFVSPMRRAQLTAEAVLGGRDCPAETLDGLREVDFGDWTGHSWEEVQRRFGISAFEWLTELHNARIANAESGVQLLARLEPIVDRVLEQHAGQTLAVVCHGGVIRGLLSLLMNLPLPETARFEINYCSVSVVDLKPHRNILQLLNHTPWKPRP